MADTRTYTGGRFALDIDGAHVDALQSFSGLDMVADIVGNDVAPGLTKKKHVANVRWTPGRASVGIGMGKGLYGWVKASLDAGVAPKNGKFTAADFNYKAQSTWTFLNALVTSFTVPRLDGASKDIGRFDIAFQAEQVRWAKAGGEDIRGQLTAKSKAWICSNFRVAIGSLPCARVASVELFTWTCAVSADSVGIFREPSNTPATVTVPDLRLNISSADLDAWSDAARKWFIDGKHLEADEMTGRITFLAPDLKEELGWIDLGNVGFKSFERGSLEAASEAVSRFTVGLYVEKMTLMLKGYEA